MFFKSDKDKAADKVKEAQGYFKQQRVSEGLALLYEASKLNPLPDTFFMIGQGEQMMRNNVAAIAAYESAIQLNQNDHEAWVRKATCLVELNKFEESHQAVQQAATIFQQQGQPFPPMYANVAQGIALLKAAYDAETEFKQNPQSPIWVSSQPEVSAKILELQALISQDGAAALNGMEDLLKANPNMPELLLWHGKIVSAIGYKDWAMRDFTRAICLHPQFTDAYMERCVLWISIGRFHEILRDTDIVLGYEPENPEAIAYRAEGFKFKGDTLSANRENEKLLKMNLSQHPNVLLLLKQGDIFLQYKRWDDALKAYETALARPNLPADIQAKAYYHRSKLFMNLNRQSDAVDGAMKAVELMPHIADYCHLLGEAGKQAGRRQDEIRGWEAYIAAVKAGSQGFLPLYVAENFLREAHTRA